MNRRFGLWAAVRAINNVYIYIYIHTYIHTYIHIYAACICMHMCIYSTMCVRSKPALLSVSSWHISLRYMILLRELCSEYGAARILKIKGPDNPTCLCFCSSARVIAHAILQVNVRMCVGWSELTTLPRKIHGSKSACGYRQSPLEHAPAKVSRPLRPKVTTIPRKIHGSKSARGYRQSPLEHAPAKVSRASRQKVTTIPRKIHGSKSARGYRRSP